MHERLFDGIGREAHLSAGGSLSLRRPAGSLERPRRNPPLDATVRFYFSFRSPYAWFAAERWQAELGALKPAVERIPFFPTPETFPNDPTRVPAKFAYIVQDIQRLARDFGLTVMPPAALDTDWARAHAAYLGVHAAEPQRSERFLIEMFRARFSRGEDVALDPVIEGAASRAGVDPATATRAAASPSLKAEVAGNFVRGQERDGIFGAPSFVYEGELFWGHDRLHHLRAALLARSTGGPSPVARDPSKSR